MYVAMKTELGPAARVATVGHLQLSEGSITQHRLQQNRAGH